MGKVSLGEREAGMKRAVPNMKRFWLRNRKRSRLIHLRDRPLGRTRLKEIPITGRGVIYSWEQLQQLSRSKAQTLQL
jgi:hypothetical protein